MCSQQGLRNAIRFIKNESSGLSRQHNQELSTKEKESKCFETFNLFFFFGFIVNGNSLAKSFFFIAFYFFRILMQ